MEIVKNLLYLRLPVISAKTEYQAIQACNKANIPTVTAVAFAEKGLNPATKQSFLMMEDLGEITSLEDHCASWRESPPTMAVKRALIKQVAELTKRLHSHGMNHRDLYLCHFVFTDSDKTQLAIMDLHRMQIRKQVPKRWLVKDLAGLLFSSFDLGFSQTDYLYFWRCYSGKPIGRSDKTLWRTLIARADRIYQRDQYKLARKQGFVKADLLSNSDAIVKDQSWGQRLLCHRDRYTKSMQHALKHIDDYFLPGNGQVIKKDVGTELVKIEVDNQPVVIKRYNIKSTSHFLQRCLRPTRAIKGWYFSHLLTSLGINTAEPVAMLEKRYGPLRGRSYLIQAFVSEQHLLDYVTKQGFDSKQAQQAIKQSAILIDKLHHLGISHGDTKATNILLRGDNVVLVDLDGMRKPRFACCRQRGISKDKRRFKKNWQGS